MNNKKEKKDLSLWVISNRWLILITVLIVTALFSIGIIRIKFNNDHRVYFGEDDPYLIALEQVEKVYAKEDVLLIAIAPKKGDIFNNKILDAVHKLTEKSWTIPFSNRVESITNFQYTFVENDDLIIENLVENPLNLSIEQIQAIKKIALNDPLVVGSLLSPSGNSTNINVTITKPGKDSKESITMANYVKAMVKEFQGLYPDMEFHLCGSIMLEPAFAEAITNDIKLLIPMMLLTLFVIIGLFLRSFSAVIITVITLFCATLGALGIAGWLKISLTTTSAIAPIIILTIAVADSIHILLGMFKEMRTGVDKNTAITNSIRINFRPVLITSLTTAIGFLSMNFSDAPPFRDLGNIVAAGIILACFYSVTLLPSLVSITAIRNAPQQRSGNKVFFNRLANYIIAHKTKIYWANICLIVISGMGISKIELDDNFGTYLDERYDFRKAFNFIMDHELTGLSVISYSLDSGQANGIDDPSYLSAIDNFVSWARTQPKVVHVHTITDIIKQLNQNLHEGNSAYYTIPEERELIAQYMLLYTMSLPFGMDLNNQINVNRSATRIAIRLANPTTKDLIEFENNAKSWLKNNVPERMQTVGAGLPIIFAHISKRNIHSMLLSSFIALVLISLLLIVALHSVKFGLISIIPNLAPIIITFGLWGYFVGEIGLTVSVVGAVSIGIIVDDTIHFLYRYLMAKGKKGTSAADAIRYAFIEAGYSIVTTTVAVCGGFIVLCFSGFSLNFHMGALTTIAILFALIMDLSFLPTIFLKLEKNR